MKHNKELAVSDVFSDLCDQHKLLDLDIPEVDLDLELQLDGSSSLRDVYTKLSNLGLLND